jgi:hypothetical protein
LKKKAAVVADIYKERGNKELYSGAGAPQNCTLPLTRPARQELLPREVSNFGKWIK